MDPELLSLDDLPEEARQLIDQTDREIASLRDRVQRQADEIRARAERTAREIEGGVDGEVRARQLQLLGRLKPLQDACVREGKLDEALAIRDRIRGLKASLLQAEPDPGTLSHLEDPTPGASLLFEVTGSTDGTVWGTDVYTGDSRLASAAVHAGVLQPGERAVVRVTFLDTLNVTFTGSTRNGIESHPFDHWPVGYRVSRV